MIRGSNWHRSKKLALGRGDSHYGYLLKGKLVSGIKLLHRRWRQTCFMLYSISPHPHKQISNLQLMLLLLLLLLLLRTQNLPKSFSHPPLKSFSLRLQHFHTQLGPLNDYLRKFLCQDEKDCTKGFGDGRKEKKKTFYSTWLNSFCY